MFIILLSWKHLDLTPLTDYYTCALWVIRPHKYLLVQMFWTLICQVIFIITFILVKLKFSFKVICNLASILKINWRPTEVIEDILKAYWKKNMTEGRRLKKCSRRDFTWKRSLKEYLNWSWLKLQININDLTNLYIYTRR